MVVGFLQEARVALGIRKEEAAFDWKCAPRGPLEGSGRKEHLEVLGVPGARWLAKRDGGKRHHLGPWVVREAEKQLVSKAAGLVCTGGFVSVLCL